MLNPGSKSPAIATQTKRYDGFIHEDDQLTPPNKYVRAHIFFVSALAMVAGLGFIASRWSFEDTKTVSRPDFSKNDNILGEKTGESVVSGTQRPHIILFTMDDVGWNDFGFHSTDMPQATPFMNVFVSSCVKLSNYYTQPSCTPSSTIMSGKYVHKTGYQNMEIQYIYGVGMPTSNKLMPKWFSERGYKTHGFGKWNIGHCDESYMPHMRGFDTFIGYFCPGHGYRDFNCGRGVGVRDLYEGYNSTNGSGWITGSQHLGKYDTELYHDHSSHVIRSHIEEYGELANENPLFLWIAHHGAHSSWDSEPEPPASLLSEENMRYITQLRDLEADNLFFGKRLLTATVMMSLDNCLKRLVALLEEANMNYNTVLIVNSDNGGDADYTEGHPGNNLPLRSEKFLYFEGGIRVPALLYAPGFIPREKWGTTFTGLVHHVDLLPTFLGFLNVDARALDSDLDGYDIMPAIINGSYEHPRDEIVFTLPRKKHYENWPVMEEPLVIRIGNYKLYMNGPNDKWFPPRELNRTTDNMFKDDSCSYSWYSHETTSGFDCQWQNWLFDVKNDPHETANLYYNDSYLETRRRLLNRAYEIMRLDYDKYDVTPGEKMHAYFIRGNTEKELLKFETTLIAHDYWVGSWGCDVMT